MSTAQLLSCAFFALLQACPAAATSTASHAVTWQQWPSASCLLTQQLLLLYCAHRLHIIIIVLRLANLCKVDVK
jgi:hypothetical protein